MAVAVLPIWASREARLDRRVKTAALTRPPAVRARRAGRLPDPVAMDRLCRQHPVGLAEPRALPFALALIPWGRELRRDWRARHTTVSMVLAVIAAVVVLCGYLADWAWTGFAGNTLWNWLHLLLLPLLLPTVIVPAIQPLARVDGWCPRRGPNRAGNGLGPTARQIRRPPTAPDRGRPTLLKAGHVAPVSSLLDKFLACQASLSRGK